MKLQFVIDGVTIICLLSIFVAFINFLNNIPTTSTDINVSFITFVNCYFLFLIYPLCISSESMYECLVCTKGTYNVFVSRVYYKKLSGEKTCKEEGG